MAELIRIPGDVLFWYEAGRFHLSIDGKEWAPCGNDCFTHPDVTKPAAPACIGPMAVCLSCIDCADCPDCVPVTDYTPTIPVTCGAHTVNVPLSFPGEVTAGPQGDLVGTQFEFAYQGYWMLGAQDVGGAAQPKSSLAYVWQGKVMNYGHKTPPPNEYTVNCPIATFLIVPHPPSSTSTNLLYYGAGDSLWNPYERVNDFQSRFCTGVSWQSIPCLEVPSVTPSDLELSGQIKATHPVSGVENYTFVAYPGGF